METIACPECDLLQRIPPLTSRAKARCARCGETLALGHRDPLDLPLALAIAAAIAFVVANTSPLMGMSAVGRSASTTLFGGAVEMWRAGSEITALMVAFCAVIAPGGHIALMLAVLVGARRAPAPSWVGRLLLFAHKMEPWSMTEVLMLGILVALVKIAELATVVAGVGMFAAGAFVALLTGLLVTFDPREVWKRVEWADGSYRPPPDLDHVDVEEPDR